MDDLSRRNVLKTLLGGVLQAAGAVVLARATVAGDAEAAAASEDVAQRAARLGQELPAGGEVEASFLNGAFRNGGGFRNGGFANGGFRNGGFANGGFRNGGFVNGGFRNGGFVNGGFRNGGWRNWF